MNHIYLIYEFRFWVQGVLLTIVGTIGLIGNTASIIVLSQSGMKNTFNQLLIWLAAFDSTFIIFAIVRCAIFDAFWWRWWRYQFVRTLYIYSFPYFIHPLTSISFMASIFTTVALSYERHKALCNPIKHRQTRAKYSVKRRTLSYVIPIVLMAIILNIPKWLELKYTWMSFESNSTNLNEKEAEIEYETVSLAESELGKNMDYIRYCLKWTNLLITGLIPFVALVYFNYGIFRHIKKNNDERSGLFAHERNAQEKNKEKASEMNLAMILLCIVIVFLVCHSLPFALSIIECFMPEHNVSSQLFHSLPIYILSSFSTLY
jgi:hypothetical protein